ncbi:MAG: hypothetical protein ACX94C_10645 [Phycisphaerales bacterium]
MGKRVYLHIGWEKTGSSAVQVFCARNQRWLNDRGLHYPLMGRLPQHIALYLNLKQGYSSLVRRSCDALRAEIERCEQDAMIFSHESLHSCSPAMFAHIFEGCDVRIVAYVRRPDAALISFFVTMARFGEISIHDMFRGIRKYAGERLGHFDYYWGLRGFESEFGRDAITVRHYDRADMVGGQTVSDLMHVIGIDDLDGAMWADDRSNLSMDVDQFAVAMRFARSLRGRPEAEIRAMTHKLCDTLMAQSTPDPSRRVERFVPESLRRRMIRCWQGCYDALYDTYFEGRRLFDDQSWIDEQRSFEGIEQARLNELASIVSGANVVPEEARTCFEEELQQLHACALGCAVRGRMAH